MRPSLRLAATGLVLFGLTGCVTRTPSPEASLAALPSLAASLPPAPAPPSAPAPAPAPAGSSPTSTVTANPGGGTTTGKPPGGTATKESKTTRAAAHQPTTAELQRALLGAGDLPGFQVDNGTDDGGGGEGGCPALDTTFSNGAKATAEVLLFRSSSSAFIRERLRQFSAETAQKAIDRVRGAPRSCGTFKTTVAALGEVTVTVGSLGMARVGDGSAAVRITMRPKIASVVAIENLVIVRRGGTLIIVTHTSLSSIEDGLTSRTVAKAYAKTQRVW